MDPNFKQPYSFTGREYDKESGLYYYRARYYDPQVGRFLSEDPIGFAGGNVNLYRYVRNNSVNFIDPWGLIDVKPGANISNLNRKIRDAFAAIDSAVQVNSQHSEAVITSGNDSRHKVGSLHYNNCAIDIRGNNVADNVMKKIQEDIEWELGPDFDVIPEFFPNKPSNDHIHIEYDP